MIKKVAIVLLAANFILYFILKFKVDSNVAASFLFCAFLLWINFVGLAVIWKLVISFHQTGLAVLMTVIKYPLIGISIFWASKQAWINSLGIVIGICAFLLIIVTTVLLNRSNQSVR